MLRIEPQSTNLILSHVSRIRILIPFYARA